MILGIILMVIGGVGLVVFLSAIMIIAIGLKWKDVLLIWGFMVVITILALSFSIGLSLIQFGKLVW